MIQHIGQDFSTSYEVHLLPGIILKQHHYNITIVYVSDVGGVIAYNHVFMNSSGRELRVVIGKDVRDIQLTINDVASLRSFTNTYQYSMRVDALILLNLAVKLLRL